MPGMSPACLPLPGPWPWPPGSCPSTAPTFDLPWPWPAWFFRPRSKRKRGSSSERIGTLTIFLPSEVMIDSWLTISPRLSLIASFTRSLWRAWSIGPLRCRDQSCWDSDTVAVICVLLHCLHPNPLAAGEGADSVSPWERVGVRDGYRDNSAPTYLTSSFAQTGQ